jgi:hypothetical protein
MNVSGRGSHESIVMSHFWKSRDRVGRRVDELGSPFLLFWS